MGLLVYIYIYILALFKNLNFLGSNSNFLMNPLKIFTNIYIYILWKYILIFFWGGWGWPPKVQRISTPTLPQEKNSSIYFLNKNFKPINKSWFCSYHLKACKWFRSMFMFILVMICFINYVVAMGYGCPM